MSEITNALNAELSEACRSGDVERARELLQMTGVNNKDFRDPTAKLNAPLHFAVKNNNKAMVALLLEYGADRNIRNKNNFTPLHFAADNNFADIVALLIQKGADINTVNRWKQTPLHVAVSKGHNAVVDELLEVKANVDILDSNKNTALHLASIHGHTDIVNQLLKAGAHVRVVNELKQTALHNAGNMEIAKLLLDAGAEVDARDKDLETPLHYAARKGAIDVLQLLIDRDADIYLINKDEYSAFDLAESPQILELLKTIDSITVMNAKNAHQFNSTFEVTLSSKSPAKPPSVPELSEDEKAFAQHIFTINKQLIQAADEGNVERVRELISDKNIDLFFQSEQKDKNTALHWAAKKGHTEIVQMLLDAGANLTIRNRNKKTPLHGAVEHNHFETVKVLLAAGAEVNAVNRWRQTALHEACIRGHKDVAELLLANGASTKVITNKLETPLHAASAYGHTEIVEFLLSAGSFVNFVNELGQTPLHVAGNKEIAERLIANGADLDIQDKDSETALHYEAKKGRVEIVRMLLDAGADVFIVNKNDFAAYDMAESAEIMQMIKDAGCVKIKVKREVQPSPSQAEMTAFMHTSTSTSDFIIGTPRTPGNADNLAAENAKLTAQVAALHAAVDQKQVQLERSSAQLTSAKVQLKKIGALYEKLFGNLDICVENRGLIIARLDRYLASNDSSLDMELQDLDFFGFGEDAPLMHSTSTFETEVAGAEGKAPKRVAANKKCTIM